MDNNPKTEHGVKKAPLHLVPPAGIIHEAMAMADGAEKYGPYNWREKNISSSIYYAACLRHLMAWWDGEECAEDSGVHHLGHARACLGILLDGVETLNDDRPVPGGTAKLLDKLIES